VTHDSRESTRVEARVLDAILDARAKPETEILFGGNRVSKPENYIGVLNFKGHENKYQFAEFN
jgi:hypothetical protein